MRTANQSDFFIELDGVGTFRFGRRTYGDRMKIRAEYLRRVKELGDDDADLSGMAQVAAEYAVLCVECPKGWESLDKLDLLEHPDAEDQIFDLYLKLKEKEGSFRRSGAADTSSEGSGAGNQQDAGVLVSS